MLQHARELSDLSRNIQYYKNSNNRNYRNRCIGRGGSVEWPPRSRPIFYFRLIPLGILAVHGIRGVLTSVKGLIDRIMEVEADVRDTRMA